MAFKDYCRTWAICIGLFLLTLIFFIISNITDDLNLIVLTLIFFTLFVISIPYGVGFYLVDKFIRNAEEKDKIRRAAFTVIYILACVGLLIVFYFYEERMPESLGFVKEGITAGVSAIIGGLALQSILDLRGNRKKDK
jgi:uncharacterized membrane-anchored protein